MKTNGSIQLHPKKGLNPRMGVCPWCGKDNGEVMLVGIQDGVYECCGTTFYGKPEGGRCPKCHSVLNRVRTLRESEKIPGGLCDECKARDEATKKAVEEGGIFWKCSKCGSWGAIKKSAPLAGAVRKEMKIAAPAPCGVEFTEMECPVCSGEKG